MKESKSGMSRCPAEIERRARAAKGEGGVRVWKGWEEWW